MLSEEAENLVEDILVHELQQVSSDAPWDSTDFFFRVHIARLNSLQEEAKSWGVSLNLEEISEKLGRYLVRLLSRLLRTFDQGDAGRLWRLLSLCRDMSVRPEAWKLQTLYFQFVNQGNQGPGVVRKHRED